jgi:hypothetical protein
MANKKTDLIKVFAILAKYPLLTTRKQCQLEFAKNCILNQDIDNFVKNRQNKYIIDNQDNINFNFNFYSVPYFKA